MLSTEYKPRAYLKLTARCLAAYNCNYKKTDWNGRFFKLLLNMKFII
jgi:hypothetical protein